MLRRTVVTFLFLGLTGTGFCDTLVPALYKATVSAGYVDYRADSQQGSGTVDASVAYSGNANTSYVGQAIAGPNHLGAYSQVQATADAANYGVGSTYSDARFVDTLHVTGPALGYLDISVDANGYLSGSAVGNGQPTMNAELDLSTAIGQCRETVPGLSSCGYLVNGSNDYFLPYLVDGSGNITLQADLIATADCSTARGSGSNSCSALSNYFDTAEIASITVTDANHHALAGDFVTSLSGVDYSTGGPPTQTPSPVPEPSSFLLLGTGLLGILGELRRRAG